MAQTEQALHLRSNLTEDKDYQYEFIDALTAVSAQVIGDDMTDLYRKARKYLSHECQACFDYFPAHKMANLCCHDVTAEGSSGECCKPCAIASFTAAIRQDVSHSHQNTH